MRKIINAQVVVGLSMSILVNVTFAQNSVQGKDFWRSIVPLVTTIQQVERAIGPPVSKNGNVLIYDAADARITIWYAGTMSTGTLCRWNVTEDTVISMVVSPKKRLLLSEVGFDLGGFKKESTPNDEVWDYVSEARGIRIETQEMSESDKVVILIHFSPTSKNKKAKCLPTEQKSVVKVRKHKTSQLTTNRRPTGGTG
jgi:hypothetical protein